MDNLYTGGTLINAGIVQLGDGSSTNRGKIGTWLVTNNAAIVLNHSGAFNLTNAISGSGSLTNLGGSPSLTGANTYSGGTTVSGGTLFVNTTTGSGTGSGAVSVQSGAGLGGTGIIGSAVSIQSAGRLVPGNGGLGTLAINGALTLGAGSTNTFDVNGTTPANDAVVLGSSVTYGGVLNIATSGTFTAGQQFVLFSGAGATNTSNFASITGSPGINMAFNFTNGVLSVISTTTTTPPTLSMAQSGSTLTFSWSDPSFKLQSQTNALNVGLLINGANWFDYPGGSVSGVTATIDPSNPTVFFRLSQ
jgi:fibronectin-binding autotransporter adhesin